MLVIITVNWLEMHPATATSGHCTANHSCRVTTDLRLNCNINNEVTAGRLFLWSFPVLRRGGTHTQNTRIQCPAKLFTTLTTTLELFLKRFQDLRSVLQQLKTHLWRYVPQYWMQVTYCVWVSPFHLDRKLCTAINQLLTSWNWHTISWFDGTSIFEIHVLVEVLEGFIWSCRLSQGSNNNIYIYDVCVSI